MKPKKNGLSREQAVQLYEDLQRNMAKLLAKTGGMPPPTARTQMKTPRPMSSSAQVQASMLNDLLSSSGSSERSTGNGSKMAIACVLFFAMAKVVFSGLEAAGIASTSPAEASIRQTANLNPSALVVQQSGPQFSKEEVTVLTSLDHRRVELEERRKVLDERESNLNSRDREIVGKIAQLKEMTEALKQDREQGEKKRNGQLDQLANVYGSMDPKEAATLIEQLDITIGLSLLQRMPEKRIGQILALMNPARALALTKMLSGKAE